MEIIVGVDVIALLLYCWVLSNIYIPTGRRRKTSTK